jgi:phage-related protein
MGGIEGSLLDAYGGEYSFNNWQVYLHSARGQFRNFAIRYGVNMLDYEEDYDSQGTYSSVIPYWTDGTDTVLGDRVDSGGATITGRGECVPLDVSDKFESKPTKAQVEAEALAYMNGHNTFYPSQNIKVDFVRLQDMGYENLGSLMQCNLCDTIRVIFPDYNASGTYKIVKTVWNVLEDRYEEMELGELSTTLSEALGITNGLGGGGGSGTEPADIIVVDNISLGSISKNGSAYEKTNCDVSASIPSGYKLTAALFSGTGSYQVYCYECRRGSDTTVVFRGYLHTGTAPASITPRATLICEKAS